MEGNLVLSLKKAEQFPGLLGIFAKHDSLQTGELVAVNYLHCSAAAMRCESQDMIEVWPATERIPKPYRTCRRAKINQRALPDVPPVRCCTRHASQLFPVDFITEKQVAAPDFLAKLAEAGGALDPSFITHGIDAASPRAKVLIKAPAAFGVDFEDPDVSGWPHDRSVGDGAGGT